MGCATVAWLAGLSKLGAEGVGGGAGAAVILRTPAIEKLSSAQMAAGVLALTAVVLTVKLVLLAPGGTVTLAGTVAAAWLLEIPRVTPPEGAGELIVTVQVEEPP